VVVGVMDNEPRPVDLGATGGAVWADPEEWTRRLAPDGCIICESGAPLNVIAEFENTWATAPEEVPLAGYVCVVARRHVVEPYQLPGSELQEFWSESMMVAEAVASVVHPVKMNYEIHGNTLPHLHLPLFPRQIDDPFVGGPVDPGVGSVTRRTGEASELGRAIEKDRSRVP
jgi:diadenosine tetraphosphate (Ap4A) HIT family hydrolase